MCCRRDRFERGVKTEMKGYVLTDKDIRILVGAAGNAVCEDRVVPPSMDMLVMEISAEIANKLIGHLSGADPFPEYVIETMETLMGILDRSEGDDRKCVGTEVSDDAECGPC